jgi:hypothetical protein
MNLESPVTVLRGEDQATFSELDLTVIDNMARRVCLVRFLGFTRPLVLWSGASYEAAGDYTQAQIEARVREILGENPGEVLQSLYA